MPPKASLIMNRLLRSFFWEGKVGGKIYHLVRWSLVSKAQSEGALGIGGLKHRNSALIAKWGWRFIHELDTLQRKVILSIRNFYQWHTSGKLLLSLRTHG